MLLLFFIYARGISAADVIVASGADWKYLDDGSNLGTAWRASSFDDSLWESGPATLGYGYGDEVTVVGYGPSESEKYITTYFRHKFIVSNPNDYVSLHVSLLRDDGAVVYLNGIEIVRSNMAGGTILYSTLAASSCIEDVYTSSWITADALTSGTNILAVEIHQQSKTSSDIIFDMELSGQTSPMVSRGPYLQIGTHNSIIIRWRTNVPMIGGVLYGASPDTLTHTTSEATTTTEHNLQIIDLQPDTRYYYSIESPLGRLTGGDNDHFFITSPPPGTSKPTRIWAVGDFGTGDSNALGVRDGYESFADGTYTNLWLLLGDNAYQRGTDEEYQTTVFEPYASQFRQTVAWPCFGNHDGYSADSDTESGVYYDVFSLPANGEAGGVSSGTEAYYSFDYANIHFICLDSTDSDRSLGGPMLQWLESDLVATTQDWIIAYFHHPPYTKGTHDSDNVSDSSGRMRDMRENVLPILEAGGVDLVLSGHSHVYERSFLVDGHYGFSNSLVPAMILDQGDGRSDGNGAYEKSQLGAEPHKGAVYVVAGSGGKPGSGSLNHPVMFYSAAKLGSIVLDVNGNQLEAKFIDTTGEVDEHFTIVKGISTPSSLMGWVFF